MVGQNPGSKDIYICVDRHPRNNLNFLQCIYNVEARLLGASSEDVIEKSQLGPEGQCSTQPARN